ncbi:MAG: glycosyltransferase [Lachnospiraceae bacterium]|nr:glycosyltransferase [Lachnospiraceae bacterium]
MSKLPISVCIIAKNEEKYIEGCLQHLKPFGFEIVVTDTGSTDRTKEIAAQYADKVLDFEWIDDFSAARNFCAQHAENNWILALDCDEYMNTFNYQEIRRLSQKFPRSVGRFQLKNIVKGPDGIQRYSVDDVVRFYNKKRFEWGCPIHEQLFDLSNPNRSLDADVKYTFFDMPMEVVHHGYDISGEEMIQKQLRNLQLLGKQLERNQRDPYTWFQIGQSQFVLQRYDKAAEAYEISLQLNDDPKKYFVEILVESLSKAYLNLDRPQDAVNILQKYADRYKTAKYVFAQACAYQENNQALQALMSYIKATSMNDRETLGEGLFTCYNNIIAIYTMMGEHEMAKMYMGLYEKSKAERERVLSS